MCAIRERPTEHDGEKREILRSAKRIAIVGLSSDPERVSHHIGKYLIGKGYEVIPVNPNHQEVFGMRCHSSLKDIAEEVDIVVVFVAPHRLPPIIDDAIATGTKVMWLQEGVVDQEQAQRARDAGVMVFMDNCIMKDHRALLN